MSGPAVSDRTVLRDAVVDMFRARQGQDGLRIPEYDVSLNYLTETECKRFPTYCVIVTDETSSTFTQKDGDCQLQLKVVIYAKEDGDVRAVLDAAIEDAYETVLLVQSFKPNIWMMTLEEISTDEGTTIAKPHAQAIQRWMCHHGRAMRAV